MDRFMPSKILNLTVLTTLVLMLCTLFSTSSVASTPEDRLKAAIVFKLTQFVEWPAKKNTLTMCVVGEGSINQELRKIHHKKTVGRRLSVTHKVANARLDSVCDILYIHNTEERSVISAISKLKGHPVLTISDHRNFAEQGGLIGLQRKGKKIRFFINQRTAKASQLSIRSQLISLAEIIK